MNVLDTAIPEVKILEPRVFGDPRGFFYESWRDEWLPKLPLATAFVQDNVSRSAHGVLRGLHYQLVQPQGKLVRVSRGAVYDVAVDMRRSSPTFGRHVGVELSAENHRLLWVPPGFAHGFCVLSEAADFAYRCTDTYAPAHERTLLWNDPALGIAWPLGTEPLLSPKDRDGKPLALADTYP